MAEQALQRLREIDRADPETAAEYLQSNLDIDHVIGAIFRETGALLFKTQTQDASFHTYASLPDAPFSLRFSRWGRLVAVLVDGSVDDELVRVATEALTALRFKPIHVADLQRPYDGDDPMFHNVGEGRWFDRFFEYW